MTKMNIAVLENVSISAPIDIKNIAKFNKAFFIVFEFIVSIMNIYPVIDVNIPDNEEDTPGLKGIVALIESSSMSIPSARM